VPQKKARTLIAGLFILLACSCGSPKTTPQVTPTTQQPPQGFTSSLDLSNLPKSPDWVPTQFAPKLVEGESVARVEVWPKNHDSITVICQIDGEQYLNPYNQTLETKWYGVIVPPSYVDPQAISKAQDTPNRNVIGYIQAFWLKGEDTAAFSAPACKKEVS